MLKIVAGIHRFVIRVAVLPQASSYSRGGAGGKKIIGQKNSVYCIISMPLDYTDPRASNKIKLKENMAFLLHWKMHHMIRQDVLQLNNG